jgi:RNA polymerase sigma-70 factor (ECF subfamily)
MQHEPVSDESLVERATQGSGEAFGELARRSYHASLKLAQSILRDRQEAEDEVQNAYLKAYTRLEQFQHNAKFTTWMTRIVVNQCLMRLRQRRRANLAYLDDAAPGEERRIPEPAEAGLTPEQSLARVELSGLLRREIARIPPMLRHAFVLREIQELPMTEVAARLGISVAAAKSRLLRARAELRERLRKHTGRMGEATLTA